MLRDTVVRLTALWANDNVLQQLGKYCAANKDKQLTRNSATNSKHSLYIVIMNIMWKSYWFVSIWLKWTPGTKCNNNSITFA